MSQPRLPVEPKLSAPVREIMLEGLRHASEIPPMPFYIGAPPPTLDAFKIPGAVQLERPASVEEHKKTEPSEEQKKAAGMLRQRGGMGREGQRPVQDLDAVERKMRYVLLNLNICAETVLIQMRAEHAKHKDAERKTRRPSATTRLVAKAAVGLGKPDLAPGSIAEAERNRKEKAELAAQAAKIDTTAEALAMHKTATQYDLNPAFLDLEQLVAEFVTTPGLFTDTFSPKPRAGEDISDFVVTNFASMDPDVQREKIVNAIIDMITGKKRYSGVGQEKINEFLDRLAESVELGAHRAQKRRESMIGAVVGAFKKVAPPEPAPKDVDLYGSNGVDMAIFISGGAASVQADENALIEKYGKDVINDLFKNLVTDKIIKSKDMSGYYELEVKIPGQAVAIYNVAKSDFKVPGKEDVLSRILILALHENERPVSTSGKYVVTRLPVSKDKLEKLALFIQDMGSKEFGSNYKRGGLGVLLQRIADKQKELGFTAGVESTAAAPAVKKRPGSSKQTPVVTSASPKGGTQPQGQAKPAASTTTQQPPAPVIAKSPQVVKPARPSRPAVPISKTTSTTIQSVLQQQTSSSVLRPSSPPPPATPTGIRSSSPTIVAPQPIRPPSPIVQSLPPTGRVSPVGGGAFRPPSAPPTPRVQTPPPAPPTPRVQTPPPASQTPRAKTPLPAAAATGAISTEEADKYKKYLGMKKAGLPLIPIELKMNSDGVTIADNDFARIFGGPKPSLTPVESVTKAAPIKKSTEPVAAAGGARGPDPLMAAIIGGVKLKKVEPTHEITETDVVKQLTAMQGKGIPKPTIVSARLRRELELNDEYSELVTIQEKAEGLDIWNKYKELEGKLAAREDKTDFESQAFQEVMTKIKTILVEEFKVKFPGEKKQPGGAGLGGAFR